MKLRILLLSILFMTVFRGGLMAFPSEKTIKIESDKITLLAAIERISQEYEVYFTFDMTLVSDVEVEYEDRSYSSAEEAISYILKGTNLKYKFYDHRFVILYKEDAEGLESLKQMSRHLDGLISEGEKTITSAPKREIRAIPTLSSKFLSREIQRIAFTVEGKVVDQEGEPLIGVNIQVKESNKATATDCDGRFTLEDSDDNAVLVVSYIGYQIQEVPVSGKSSLEIILAADSQFLEEIVVVGYSQMSKRSISGSVENLNVEKINKINPVTTSSQLLQGMVPGLISNSSNTPGANASILIRGIGTINDASPLIVVDGIPSSLNNLNPSEIESISVLKDAASTAIYGSRGANGVILVETIKGRSDKPVISFNAKTSISSLPPQYDFLNPEEYGEMLWMSFRNSGLSPSHPVYGNGDVPRIPKYIFPSASDNIDVDRYHAYDYQIIESTRGGTSRDDYIYQNGQVQAYDLSISGTKDKLRYGLFGGFVDEIGSVQYTGFNRMNFRSNISLQLFDWLEIGENFGISSRKQRGRITTGTITNLLIADRY